MINRPGILWFVLNEASSELLRRAVPPMYKNEFYHHVTLRYGIEEREVAELIGKEWQVQAYAAASNAQAQACRVDTNGLPDEYGMPHITLSTAKGVKPFASIAMFKGEHTEAKLQQPIELSGTVEFEYLDHIED